ncbi:MAG: SpaA isopeptide-forming pilin-related protein [Ignavibacterium sp.]|jgi:hypothetical protein|nr:SpaA isopeptide-forming pilin-related protein [Ignavibacterium sp.]
MSDHKGNTGKSNKIKLKSSIDRVIWTAGIGCNGAEVGLEINTHFVGNNSEVKIEISDASGKVLDTIKTKIAGNYLLTKIKIPEKAKDELYAEVKLSKLGLSKKSNCLYVYLPPKIKNLKWDKQEARRGDVLKISADVTDTYEGAECKVLIFEHDDDGAHDLIASLKTNVKNQKIEVDWEFKFQTDTKNIPTDQETEKGYKNPEYFFRVDVGGVYADSDLLKFKDWIEIKLEDQEGNPLKDISYKIKFSDGKNKEGKLDSNGYAKIENVPPGKYEIEFENIKGIGKSK